MPGRLTSPAAAPSASPCSALGLWSSAQDGADKSERLCAKLSLVWHAMLALSWKSLHWPPGTRRAEDNRQARSTPAFKQSY